MGNHSHVGRHGSAALNSDLPPARPASPTACQNVDDEAISRRLPAVGLGHEVRHFGKELEQSVCLARNRIGVAYQERLEIEFPFGRDADHAGPLPTYLTIRHQALE